MKKDFNWFNQGMRPAAVMLLCTCIAFSAAAPYMPPEALTAADRVTAFETQEETEKETDAAVKEEESTEETSSKSRDLTAPAPYRLNFAYMFDESGESYAEILMKELIARDSRWYAQIYDMANMAPASLASRLGRSQSQVLGKYNPASRTQDKNNPSTWAVEHFKNVRVSFYDGDGNITSAVSNAQQILAMASVYCYYNGIEDLEQIRDYVDSLWSQSHSYSVSMGDVYYCGGCVDPDQAPADEEDSELEGEDYFNGESTINTEITVKESGSGTEDGNGDPDGESLEEGMESSSLSESKNPSAESIVRSDGTVIVPQTERTTPAYSGTTMAVETTKSALDSLAETAESVYIEESRPRVTIVRPGETTTAAPKTAAASETSKSETDATESAAASLEDSKEESAESTAAAPEETTSPRKATIVRPEESESRASAEAGLQTGVNESAPAAKQSGQPVAESVAALEDGGDPFEEEYKVHMAALETAEPDTSNSGTPALICPGHIDLKITATVYSLDETTNLFERDQTGNAVEEGSSWSGWNDRAKAFVSHIDRQDWTEVYDISITVEGTRAPLSSTEIESYMNKLPEGTSEVRKDIIRFALQSVGKVPYYWGGKPSAQNYTGNNFGSVTIPDHRGRILRGLDCSGWINWVYWSVTGEHLPYEGTEGLRALGRQVNRSDLKPGDIVVITGSTPHVIMFLGWMPNGQIQCIHETGSVNNVTVSVMNANWPYYRNLLD